MKVLLVKTSSMGDLIHTLYSIEDLAKYRSDIELHWICEESFVNIPKLHPFIHKVITFSWREYRQKLWSLKTWNTMREIREFLVGEKYDLVIDSQGLIKSAIIASLAKAPIHGFNKDCIREKIAVKFYTHHYHIQEKDNVIWKNRQLFSLIFNYRNQIDRNRYVANLQIPEHINLDFLDYENFHVVVQGASQDYKLWTKNNWQALLKKKHMDDAYPVLLTWGNEKEYEASRKIAEGLDFVYLCPKMDLIQVAKLIDLSTSVVSVDTGLLHLANALNKPTVGIYPNSSTGNTMVENRNWEQVIGGLNSTVSVEQVYSIWNEVLKNKEISQNN
ncbi:MAG: lipopolysaccharide heptosyltransferase I [Neisseriaceae bacterium]|nr:MAG: lipopolysaccharide heptosyltransferase I [Neisseriaceae bacterium]